MTANNLKKAGIKMGFWYFLILFAGIAFIGAGAAKKDVSRSVKIVVMLFILGIVFIFISLVLFMPGSSEIISQLLDRN